MHQFVVIFKLMCVSPPVVIAVLVLTIFVRWYLVVKEQEKKSVYMMVDRILGITIVTVVMTTMLVVTVVMTTIV